MSIESFLLPAPVTVYQQTNHTCWAACYRSLLRTNGSGLSFTEVELENLFRGYLLSNGSLSGRGVHTEAHLAMMTIVRVGRGSHLNLHQIRNALQFGYVILAYKFPHYSGSGPRGHVVLAYGVDSSGIHVMNPDQTGPGFLTVEYLKNSPSIMFARQMFPTMVTNPFNAVR